MSPQASAIQGVLDNLREGLAAAQNALLTEPRPGAGILESAVAAMEDAREKLASAISDEGFSSLPEADRLELVKRARQVQGQLKVLSRLVSGSARFASLSVEGNGRKPQPRQATYGPDGGSPNAPPGEGLERSA